MELIERLIELIAAGFGPFCVIVILVIVARAKAGEKRKQKQRQIMSTLFEPAAAPVTRLPGQIHLSSVLPDRKPPAVTQMHKQVEGVEFHPPGFHGDRGIGYMEKPKLEKVDLGALRAQQNAHVAADKEWKAPEPAVQTEKAAVKPAAKPMFTAAQLRNAFIMQEILDEPVSRRTKDRRSYGR